MEKLYSMFGGLKEYPNLVQEVYISSNCNVDDAVSKLLQMGFEVSQETEVPTLPPKPSLLPPKSPKSPKITPNSINNENKEDESPSTLQDTTEPLNKSQIIPSAKPVSDPVAQLLPSRSWVPSQLPSLPPPPHGIQSLQPQANLALQLSQRSQPVGIIRPAPIPTSAPIPIPSPTKKPTNLNSSVVYPTRDSHRVVGNLRVGERIRNCKKSIKELIHHDKTEYVDSTTTNTTPRKDMTISVTEAIRNEYDEIEIEHSILENEKKRFAEEKARFQADVMRFSQYVQTEYKMLITSQQEWMATLNSVLPPRQQPTLGEERMRSVLEAAKYMNSKKDDGASVPATKEHIQSQ